MNNDNKVFYCYSPTLKNELLSINLKYIAKSVNPTTNRSYWMFLFTDTLKEYLDIRPKNYKKIITSIKNPKLN